MSYSAGLTPGTTAKLDPGITGGAGSSGVALGTGTGQHGIGLTGGMMGNPFAEVWAWLNRPLTTPLSLWSVGKLVGGVLIAMIVWNLILYHIRIAAETL